MKLTPAQQCAMDYLPEFPCQCGRTDMAIDEDWDEDGSRVYLRCHCGACGPSGRDEEDAVTRWNEKRIEAMCEADAPGTLHLLTEIGDLWSAWAACRADAPQEAAE